MSWSQRHRVKLMCIETKCALKTQVRFLVPPTPGGPGLRPALCGLSRDATRLPIPPRRGPHRPRTRVAALETMRGPGPACLVGVSALQTVSKTEACAPATLSSLRRELRASRGWSKPEGGGGGRGLHPTPPRSQAEPKLGGSGGLPAARSPPGGPRRPRDSPGGDAHSPPVARRTIPLPSTCGGRGPRAWAALPTELTPPERGFASSPLPRLVVSGAPRRAWCALNERSQCRGGRRRGAGANPLVPCGVNVSKHNRFVYRSRVLNLSKFTSKCDGCLCVSLLSVRAQSSVSE